MEATRPRPKAKAKRKAKAKSAHKPKEKEEEQNAEQTPAAPSAAATATQELADAEQDPLEVHSAVSSGDGAAQNGVSLLLPSVVVPTLESADPVVRHPLEVHQPQLVEGRGEGVVSGDDLINFDSITTAMATSAQSQVTEEKDLVTEQEQVVEKEVEPVGVVSAPAETSQVQELDELRTESPVRQQVAEATNQISDDVLVQQEAFVQEDAQTVTNQITAVAGTVEVQSTAPLLIAEDERVCEPVYPGLDSLIAASVESEQLIPYTEEDLALLCPNPQLAANDEFVENFIRESHQEQHPLAKLLQQYLNARLALRTANSRVEGLRRDYDGEFNQIWTTEQRSVAGSAKCSDGTKVSQNHLYQFAIYSSEAARRVEGTLNDLRAALQCELCMKSYSAQLACIHVENYLYQLLLTLPEVVSGSTAITGYLPLCRPGGLDTHTAELRNCISVLFLFERRPMRDQQFRNDTRKWLDLLLSALLRTASLSDHQFILHHLLRSPPSVSSWAAKYLQPPSPITHTFTPPRPFTNRQDPNAMSYVGYLNQEWNAGSTGLGGCDWGGAVLDMLVTMLASLLQPISGRVEFLAMLTIPPQQGADGVGRQESELWTYVDEELEELDATDEAQLMMLKESDYIALFEQIPIRDVFQHILQVPQDGSYSVTYCTSTNMLRLIAFSTSLITILGNVFTTLRHSRYKEFVKQVGRTIRQTVHFVADHWINYKAMKEAAGDTPTAPPFNEDPGMPRYSLARLQVEFDQCVLRATRWILTAHKLGAWQFMADMPYKAVTLSTLWQILWILYNYQLTNAPSTALDQSTNSQSASDQLNNNFQIPQSVDEILASIKDAGCHTKLVDVLMKTYTSEAVFLLTTFVNMARSRTAVNDEERLFINTITREIFEFTQVDEYAREPYSKMGQDLIGAIATVHPFTLSTLLERAVEALDNIGENCVLMFQKLPLYLWYPSPSDVETIRHWLVTTPLYCHHNMLAMMIINGLNWGVETNTTTGSCDLVLEESLHRYMALTLVDAYTRHLPNQPGGSDYSIPSSTLSSSSTVSTLTKYAASFRSSITTEQQDFTSWMWEVALMLKLHPTQIQLLKLTQTKTTSNITTDGAAEAGAKSAAVYRETAPTTGGVETGEIQLPDLSSTGLDPVRESVHREGLVGYYVALNISNIGSDPGKFAVRGIPMLLRLQEQGYHLPVLKVLSSVTPLLFKHKKVIVNDQSFIQLVHNLANSDSTGSLKERLLSVISSSSPPLIVQKLAAMIATQLQQSMSSETAIEIVLSFWLDTFFSIPSWIREQSILYLLDSMCVLVCTNEHMRKVMVGKLLEQYQLLQPLQQKNRRLISSVASSVLSIVGQESGPPSLYTAISQTEYPWLAYYTLCAEQALEEEEGVWKGLLTALKKDGKISVDAALKKSLSSLHHNGTAFNSSHLCIYRWADFCCTVDHAFLLMPFAWQQFFALYLQRPLLESTVPERGSLGLRFFSSSSALSQRRTMKSTLILITKNLQNEIDQLLRPAAGETETEGDRAETQEKMALIQNCLKFYKTLKSWLEDPRLHDETLHLPGLPPQYAPDRLKIVFSHYGVKTEWVEFVKVWEVTERVKMMKNQWLQVVSYQKQLPSTSESLENSPNIAASRIEKRLKWKSNFIAPPSFHLPAPPFQMVTREMLLDRDAVVNIVLSDINFITQQARVFSERVNMLAALDSEFTNGIPDLYSNQPRQFHVNVPCRSKFSRSHVCSGPATIVFRFNERTPHSVWEERLRQNRAKHTDITAALSAAVPGDFCKAVARTEHVIGELSNQCTEQTSTGDNPALTCGVALFYEILKFVTAETKSFPPSCQFLSSCVDVLGQEFIERDPDQAVTLLQLLLHQRMLGGLLAPLFHPNGCPAKFLEMYASVGQVAKKEGPSVAFSVLSKFNLSDWLEQYAPPTTDCTQLLGYVYHGIEWCGHTPEHEHLALCGVYRIHLKLVTEYNFPNQYSTALQLLVDGTDTNQLNPTCWQDLIDIITDSSSSDNCCLGLQQIQDTLSYLTHHYMEKRLFAQECLYDLLSHDYIKPIGQLLRMLCLALAARFISNVDMGNNTHEQALKDCWSGVVDVFAPWITTVQSTASIGGTTGGLLPPCKQHDELMSIMMSVFCEIISKLQSLFSRSSSSPMYLLWFYYCSCLALPNTAPHIMHCYHTHLLQLPWKQFYPDTIAMESMIKLKSVENFPKSSFLFVGKIFPLIDWQTIIAICSTNPDPAVSVQFHNVLLQLLLMLACTDDIMAQQDCLIPNLLADASSYNWHYIDAKMLRNLLDWLQSNSDPTAVLQTGSSLSAVLRLLRAVSSFPSSYNDSQHTDGWEKRLAYMQFVIDLISRASQSRHTHSMSYSDAVNYILQVIVDVIVYEPKSDLTPQFLQLVQEFLNLYNTSHPSPKFQEKLQSHLFDSLQQMPNAHLLTLPIISAGSHVLVAIPTMVSVVEHTIAVYFTTLPAPETSSIPLPYSETVYGWSAVTIALSIPGTKVEEFVQWCLSRCAALSLHTHLLQLLTQCTSIEQEYSIACKVVEWCTLMKPIPQEESRMFLIWEKALSLLVRQVKFSGSVANIPTQLSNLASLLQRFGEDKASDGLLGVIGLGKKSLYSLQFRLISRALSTHIYCQTPLDNSTQLSIVRVAPCSPGHVKDPFRNQPGFVTVAVPLKQADQSLNNLEALVNNKNYVSLKEKTSYAVGFISDLNHTLLNSVELLVCLSVWLYPQDRYLDALRVL